jgi:hypothetical protein
VVNKRLMDSPTVGAEKAFDQDEAIREEIRARLRAAGDDKDDRSRRPLLFPTDRDVAALRLLSGCG